MIAEEERIENTESECNVLSEHTASPLRARVEAAAERLLDRLEQAVRELDAATITHKEKEKTEAGEILREYTEKLPRRKGLIDRGGLKQLTGVLKDLQDILYRDPELESREQEAKLEKLRQELADRENSDGITVMLSQEADSYAS